MIKISRIVAIIFGVIVVGAFLVARAQSGPPSGGGGGGGGTSPSNGGGGGGSVVNQTISVSKNGSGLGTVVGGVIDCGNICEGKVVDGTSLTLTAKADTDSAFITWGGDCASAKTNASCTLTMDANKSVTATFDIKSSSVADAGDDEDSGSTYASDFQKNVTKFSAKIKKIWLGHTPIIGQKKPMNLPFTGKAIGANWRIMTIAGEPVAQGILVSQGSHISITVNMVTGAVSVQFNSRAGCWIVSYTNNQGAERKEMFKCMGDSYQEELIVDEDDVVQKFSLLMHNATLFGMFDGGSFFAVNQGKFPEMPPAIWADNPIPHKKKSLIPVEKILNLLEKFDALPKQVAYFAREIIMKTAYAAEKAMTAIHAYQRITAYRQALDGLFALQEVLQKSFAMIDMDDPDSDEAVLALVEEYQDAEEKVATMRERLGRFTAFVRDGNWLYEERQTTADLIQQGVNPALAAMVAQIHGSFDMYVVTDAGAKSVVSGFSCAPSVDADDNPYLACEKKRVKASEARAILTARDVYSARASEAHDALERIETALFVGSGN